MKTYEPKFKLGQPVVITLKGKIEGVETTVEKTLQVRAIKLESNTETVYIEYGLTDDLCGPYHYGNDAKWWRKEGEISPLPTTPATATDVKK